MNRTSGELFFTVHVSGDGTLVQCVNRSSYKQRRRDRAAARMTTRPRAARRLPVENLPVGEVLYVERGMLTQEEVFGGVWKANRRDDGKEFKIGTYPGGYTVTRIV